MFQKRRERERGGETSFSGLSIRGNLIFAFYSHCSFKRSNIFLPPKYGCLEQSPRGQVRHFPWSIPVYSITPSPSPPPLPRRYPSEVQQSLHFKKKILKKCLLHNDLVINCTRRCKTTYWNKTNIVTHTASLYLPWA